MGQEEVDGFSTTIEQRYTAVNKRRPSMHVRARIQFSQDGPEVSLKAVSQTGAAPCIVLGMKAIAPFLAFASF